MSAAIYTAIVQKRVTSYLPRFDTAGRKIYLDASGKPIPRDDKGELTAQPDRPAVEEVRTDSTDDPLTDEAGNPVEAGTPEALLRQVVEHFESEKDVEVLRVWVRKTETVLEVAGENLSGAAGRKT